MAENNIVEQTHNSKKLDKMNKSEILQTAKEMKKKLNELDSYDKLLQKIETLEKNLSDAEERIFENETELNKLNQYTRRENLEIVGIPRNIGQRDLESHAIKIFNAMGVECNSYDIAACHRLNKKDSSGNKLTIVRFICRKKVIEILSNKKKLSEDQIKNKLNKKEYFIQENLSPMNRQIMDSCIYLRKKKQLTSCWSFNGTINIKITDDDEEKQKKLYHYEDIFYYIKKAEDFI